MGDMADMIRDAWDCDDTDGYMDWRPTKSKWAMSGGTMVAYSDMGDRHLWNAIAWLRRQYEADRVDPGAYAIAYPRLMAEAKARGLLTAPKITKVRR